MPNACTGKPLEAGPHFLISKGDPVFLGGGGVFWEGALGELQEKQGVEWGSL